VGSISLARGRVRTIIAAQGLSCDVEGVVAEVEGCRDDAELKENEAAKRSLHGTLESNSTDSKVN
jgi:hypothetical protein